MHIESFITERCATLVLTHRHSFGDGCAHNSGELSYASGGCSTVESGKAGVIGRNTRTSDKVCNYCHKKGHWKSDCYVLKTKARPTDAAQAKGACLVVSVQNILPDVTVM